MAMSIDFPTKVITVPRSDLALVSGTIYTMDTEGYFRTELMSLMDDAIAMHWPQSYFHETESTIAGVTYARKIKIINGYSVVFTPNEQWTVILEGSNNDIFDVENGILVQNQVQVIPTNSAGLIVTTVGSGLSIEQAAQLKDIYKLLGLDNTDSVTVTPAGVDSNSGDIDINFTGDGVASTTMERQ